MTEKEAKKIVIEQIVQFFEAMKQDCIKDEKLPIVLVYIRPGGSAGMNIAAQFDLGQIKGIMKELVNQWDEIPPTLHEFNPNKIN